jgi:hypothetical protein
VPEEPQGLVVVRWGEEGHLFGGFQEVGGGWFLGDEAEDTAPSAKAPSAHREKPNSEDEVRLEKEDGLKGSANDITHKPAF